MIFVELNSLYLSSKNFSLKLKKYKNAKFYWCQEEPQNMGAWNTVREYIERTLEIIQSKRIKLNM